MRPLDFILRWSPRDHAGFRRFFNELVALMQAERAAERRRLTTDRALYERAVEETRQELVAHAETQGGPR